MIDMMNNIIKKIKEYIYLYNISKNEDVLELIYLFENNEPDEIEKELILSSRVENKNTILTEIANYIFVLYCKEKNSSKILDIIKKYIEINDFEEFKIKQILKNLEQERLYINSYDNIDVTEINLNNIDKINTLNNDEIINLIYNTRNNTLILSALSYKKYKEIINIINNGKFAINNDTKKIRNKFLDIMW